MDKPTKNAWISLSGVQGIRYREHPERKFLRKPDRYFAIRRKHTIDGVKRQIEEGVGWASDGYTPERVREIRATLIQRTQELGRVVTLDELRREHSQSAEDQHQQTVLRRQQDVTFAHAAEAYMTWARTNKRSHMTDVSRLRVHVLPFLGQHRMADITPVLIESLRRRLQSTQSRIGHGPLSDSSVTQMILLVSAVFRQARLLPFDPTAPQLPIWTGDNPCREIRLKKSKTNRWRILDDNTMQLILSAAQDLRLLKVRRIYSTVNHMLVFHDAIMFSRHTGARLAEVCGLRWVHTDLQSNTIRLIDETTKSMVDRTVHAPMGTLDMLTRRAAARGSDDFVFQDGHKKMCPDRMSHAFKNLIDHLGLNEGFTRNSDKVVFHTLRHTFGTRFIMDGGNPMVLKKLMGHASWSTTERYVHLAEEFMRGQVHQKPSTEST